MSWRAIAAALALEDVGCGERLVAFSLASFAGRDQRAWPGVSAAAARAGLGRSRYLEARDLLVRRGLVVVEDRAGGRGRSSTVRLAFAEDGPRWEAAINAPVFEAVLSRSRAIGPARLLLAALAALADDDGVVSGLATGELCAAAGVADRTYRRARKWLLASGEVTVDDCVGGRGNTNVWRVSPPPVGLSPSRAAPMRVAPKPGARPLMAALRTGSGGAIVAPAGVDRIVEKRAQGQALDIRNHPGLSGDSRAKGGQDRTVSPQTCPGLSGVSGANTGQGRTPFDSAAAETPAPTPAETPAPNARAGTEAWNQRTKNHPPVPPEWGTGGRWITVEETHVTDRGGTRRRMVRVDLDEVRRGLREPGVDDEAAWEQIRELFRRSLPESTYAIWLEPIELLAVDGAEALVVSAPETAEPWVRSRYRQLLDAGMRHVGRQLRFADAAERQALGRRDQQLFAISRQRQPSRRRAS